jgi:nucleoid-associated protein EbfC
MGSGFSKKKKQMRALQEQFAQMQSDLAKVMVTGSAGNGLVMVQLTGEYEVAGIQIKPECVDPEDVGVLQDLIKAAYTDALEKLRAHTTEQGLPDLSALGSLGL